MHAAEPARRHEPDPGGPARSERSTDRRRPDDALHDGGCEVARAELPSGRVEPAKLHLREPDHELAVEHADRRRHDARLAHGALGGKPDLDAFARWEAVGDERRLERDHTAAFVECSRHLVGEPDHGIAPSRAQQRAAAASPSSAPPTRNPAASASPAPVVSTTFAASAG